MEGQVIIKIVCFPTYFFEVCTSLSRPLLMLSEKLSFSMLIKKWATSLEVTSCKISAPYYREIHI